MSAKFISILVLTAILSGVMASESAGVIITVAFIVLILLSLAVIPIVFKLDLDLIKNRRYRRKIESILRHLDNTYIDRISISTILFLVYCFDIVNDASITWFTNYPKIEIRFTFPALVASIMIGWIASAGYNIFSVSRLVRQLNDKLNSEKR